MELVTPGIGLILWTSLAFLIVMFLLKKFAWKPILQTLKEREEKIEKSLALAKEAEKRIAELHTRNENLIAEAAKEREEILRAARQASDRIVAEARERAEKEAQSLIDRAKESIENERMKAVTELRNQVGILAIEIAEKILRTKVSDKEQQEESIRRILDDIKMN